MKEAENTQTAGQEDLETLPARRKEIEAVIDYIALHYNEKINWQTLSNVVFLSPTYLKRLFKREMRTNLNPYLLNLRLARSCELLVHSDRQIQDISRQVGIASPSYFSMRFKENYGVEPTEYRKRSLEAGPE